MSGGIKFGRCLIKPMTDIFNDEPSLENHPYRNSMDIVSPYLDEHRPEFQECINGVPINPNLRSDFDDTDNEVRDPLEISDWWGKPFIRIESWDDSAESWESHVERLKQNPDIEIAAKEAYEAQQIESKKSWLRSFPTGFRYEVRCLDGGAWDRSTLWGMVGSLEEAMQVIKKRSN